MLRSDFKTFDKHINILEVALLMSLSERRSEPAFVNENIIMNL